MKKFLNKNSKDEMKMSPVEKIVTGILYLGYFVYLYVLFTNWQLASGGNIFIGVVQGVIPLSAVIFISLVLSGDIKVTIPIN